MVNKQETIKAGFTRLLVQNVYELTEVKGHGNLINGSAQACKWMKFMSFIVCLKKTDRQRKPPNVWKYVLVSFKFARPKNMQAFQYPSDFWRSSDLTKGYHEGQGHTIL